MRPIGPNFRRFVSPTDPGGVVVRQPRRRPPPRDEPLEGTKAMMIPTEDPKVDWMRTRTLHHYPYEALAGKLGIAAFIIVCAMVVLSLGLFFIDWEYKSAFTPPIIVLGIALTNLCGIFSQILSGGRCWFGAVALASIWVCVFVYLLIAMS